MRLRVEIDRIQPERWTASTPDLAEVRAEGRTREEALRAVQVLALRALADRLERSEPASANAFDVEVTEGPHLGDVIRRGLAGLEACQHAAAARGADTMSMDEIDELVSEVRRERRQHDSAASSGSKR